MRCLIDEVRDDEAMFCFRENALRPHLGTNILGVLSLRCVRSGSLGMTEG